MSKSVQIVDKSMFGQYQLLSNAMPICSVDIENKAIPHFLDEEVDY